MIYIFGGLMMYQQDWLMRQIEAFAAAIARIVLGKAEVSYEIQDEANHTETDMLYLRLNELLNDGNINAAEDLLFERIKAGDTNYFLLALDFYQRLNDKSDDELEHSSFSREEIETGLFEVMSIFGVKI